MLFLSTTNVKRASLPQFIQLPFFINPIKSFLDSRNHFHSQHHSLASIVGKTLPSSELDTSQGLSLSFNYASILKSCIAQKAIEPGRQLHAHIFLTGRGYEVNLVTKLVNLYCICGYLSAAHLLFDRISKDNPFIWNVLIRGYAWNGPYEVAISLYFQMINYGLVPDNFTFPFVLKACSSLSAIEVGRYIHQHAIHRGWETDVFVGAALIDMYAKCGCISSSLEIFDKITNKDCVLWNSMLAAYSQNGQPEKCLSFCGKMTSMGLRPTEATLVTAISASADIAALPQGRELHGVGWRLGFDSQDKVKTALIDMYAKCGFVKVARVLFEQLLVKKVVSWNAMIAGYAMHGYAKEALDLFDRMTEVAQPDHITFVGILSACNRGGLLDEGRKYFELMIADCCLEPSVQHYSCMVDLLGHSGLLNEAYNLIMQMKVAPDSGIWGALLNSCKIQGNVELGELALERLIELEPNDAGNYVILSNLYAQKGRWEGVAKLRKLMLDRQIKKSIACSWIEVKNKVHAFLSGDTFHPMSDEIYMELERVGGLMSEAGYVPNITPVFHDINDDEKTSIVHSHSERLAIAFGLISTPPGTRLIITKNLRVCEDCHVAINIISKITKREITVRDVNRYHNFKDGFCSCGDYW